MARYPDPRFVPNIVLFLLGIVLLLYSFFTAGFGNWNEKNLWRYCSSFLFIICIIPYFIRVLEMEGDPLERLNIKLFKPYHIHIGMMAFLVAVFHGLYEGRCNIYIELGMLVYSFLMTTGVALWLKVIPPENFKRIYLLHTHHILVFLLISLVVLGHILENL